MPIVYRLNVLQALKDAGYNTNKIRKKKIMGEAMLQKLREGQMVSWATLETICALLNCQPGDLIEYVKENDDYELLAEKESMWAKMLDEVLKDNGIPCVTVPVFGAGFTLKTGMQERLKVYVPSESKSVAEELMHELFPAEEITEVSE